MKDPTVESRREQLFRLLPRLYQALDAEQVADGQSGPLRELLSVVGEQVNLLEDDLDRWHDNWFIETCEDWVVPYLGDLVGYESASKDLITEEDPESPLNRAVVFPRREVADTIALRRRKGTLAILEELSRRVVGWPARAVEFRRFTAGSASSNHLRARRSSTVDVRDLESLALLDTPFDRLPRTIDVRRINSHRTKGRHNLPAIGLFVYRRKIDSATLMPAYCLDADEGGDGSQFLLSTLGVDVPLQVRPQPETDPTTIAEAENLPGPLTRQLLRASNARPNEPGVNPQYYGLDKSLYLLTEQDGNWEPIPPGQIVVCDLKEWSLPLAPDAAERVAVDPERGRVAFPAEDGPPDAVLSVHYVGRAAYIGAGEYDRRVSGPRPYLLVGQDPKLKKLEDAILRWHDDQGKPDHAVIEIVDNWEYDADIFLQGADVCIPANKTLEIRAANRRCPTLHIPDQSRIRAEQLLIRGEAGSRVILDGLTLARGQLAISGPFAEIVLRHCTFRPGHTTIFLDPAAANIVIDRCMLGHVTVLPSRPKKPAKKTPAQPTHDPACLTIQDSVLDPGSAGRKGSKGPPKSAAIGDKMQPAYFRLTVNRSTILGTADVHAVDRIENSIFHDRVCVQNCLAGCVRFSFIPPPDSSTPPQFHCQPSLAQQRLSSATAQTEGDSARARDLEMTHVTPRFASTTFGDPDYARLMDDCAPEILQGADDEGEMGVYHNEFFPQRAAHLRHRIQEFIPAGSDAEIIFET